MNSLFWGSANVIKASTVVMLSSRIFSSASVFGNFAFGVYKPSMILGASAWMYGVATFKSELTNIDRTV